MIYLTLAYLKLHNKFYEDISISKGPSSQQIVKVFWYCSNSRKNENDTNKIICDRKEVTENRNYTETEYASVEDLLSVHRTA